MQMNQIVEKVKKHPDMHRSGMILCHNGIVRQTSRDGRRVNGLRVKVDHEKLAQILAAQRQRPGIVDVQVQIAEDRDLTVGDDVMLLVVAGDYRENVVAVLADTLDQIKTSVTQKTEYFS